MYLQYYPFVRYAMIVGVLIALCASLLGVTLVLKRFSFIGDGLSHVAFGAMAIAGVLNLSNDMLLIMPVTILCAILLLRTGQNAKIKGDAAIAMISVGALALGYLLMNIFSTSSNVSGDVCSTHTAELPHTRRRNTERRAKLPHSYHPEHCANKRERHNNRRRTMKPRKTRGCAAQNVAKPAAQPSPKKAIRLMFATFLTLLLTAATPLFAQNAFLDFLYDGCNSATGSLGFIAGGATSGEVFRADVHAQRETDLYSAAFGFEFTDECFSLLLNGGIYWNATENLRLGAVLTYNPLFMFSAMAEQNIVPAATFAINLNDNSKLDIELGMLYKTDRFFELPSGNNCM